MSSSNLWRRLKGILPDAPLEVGTVQSVTGGVAVVLLPGGGLINARGDTTVGAQVYVRDGRIEGTAPALTIVTQEI